MAQQGHTFRVFVSSTFSDLKAERNALQQRVFPRLRKLAAEHGCRFQAIDLRWGVSEEASLDQQAMNICLGEITRCQQTSPRPNFIVLLGDRYGWSPPPSQIPARDFDKILEMVESEDRALLKEWYSLDENAVPPEWRLKARQRGSQYEDFASWQPVESKLQAILEAAVKELTLTEEQRLPYTASATEQEIAAGALRVKEASEHVLCFFRSIDEIPPQFIPTEFYALVAARVKQEYPDGLSASCKELVKDFLVSHPNPSAKDLAGWIHKTKERTPRATPEDDILSLLQQALVDFTARDFLNLDEGDWTVDEKSRSRQNALKKRLQDRLPERVFTYHARWTGDGITLNHIEQLCEEVYNSLAHIIQDEIDNPHEISTPEDTQRYLQVDEAMDEEALAHRKFAGERLRYFVGRKEILSKITTYLMKNERRCLAIAGGGGTGKSALIAKAVQQAQGSHGTAQIIYRFIGATPGSSDGRSLLDSLCHEISSRYGADPATIPMDYRDLVPELGKRMQLASAERPLILFLDSLDQLSPSQGTRSLIWLPNELPEHVHVIATTREEDTFENLKSKRALVEQLGGLSRQEGADLLSEWLSSVQRTLQPPQFKAVLDHFEQSQGNPLYLKLAFEEARLWTSSQPPEQLATGVRGIIEKNTIDRMAREDNHGQMMVSRSLGYLAASRYGLAEDELVDLLSRDLQVYRWFLESSYHLPADLIQWAAKYLHDESDQTVYGGVGYGSNEERAALDWLKEIRTPPEKLVNFLSEVLPRPDGPRLPVVLWSRLSFDLEPYLTERIVDGSSLLYFYHRELGEAATRLFLQNGKEQPFHEKLASYFRDRADPERDRSWKGIYRHGLSELPYHLTRAEQWDAVYETLTDFRFLEQKAAEVGVLESQDDEGSLVKTYTGVYQLQEDYDRALEAQPGEGGSSSGRGQHPLIITAVDRGKGLTIYCPVCNQTSPISKEQLDIVITCPTPNCGRRLKINPFFTEMVRGK